MNINEFISPAIQLVGTGLMFAFILGKYKTTFDQQKETLKKHEQAIDKIIIRLDLMNNEFSFMKGWIVGQNKL